MGEGVPRDRVIMGELKARDAPAILVASLYMKTKEGPSVFNAGLLEGVLRVANEMGLPYLVAADWQRTPEEWFADPLVRGSGA